MDNRSGCRAIKTPKVHLKPRWASVAEEPSRCVEREGSSIFSVRCKNEHSRLTRIAIVLEMNRC